MKFRKELVGATGTMLILSILSRGAAHGYEITRRLEEQSEGILEQSEGTLYPALHKLEKSGLIKGDWQTTQNGRRRRVYALTRKGRGQLSDQSSEWKIYSKAVNRTLENCHV